MFKISLLGLLVLSSNLYAYGINNNVVINPTAYIPSQCYTQTIDHNNKTHNPCFTCHRKSEEPNYVNDYVLQEVYDFPELARTNPYTNLFKDRTKEMSKLSDKEILQYIRTDNYKSAEGEIGLAKTIRELPINWDFDGNKRWDGYIPDSYFNFDQQGFDKKPDGSYSGWRAFAYYPFPGTFWPANGSTDDVLIRLSPAFMHNDSGEFDLETYKINLSIVEAMIKMRDIQISMVDEKKYGVDLNRDGVLNHTDTIVYKWEPLKDQNMSYVGEAKVLLQKGELHIAGGLYPEGTEFLHSVRYIDIKDQKITMAAHMKELRYAIKKNWVNYSTLGWSAKREARMKIENPDVHEIFKGDGERGMWNGQGWLYQGFIEDADGSLRPQSNEETLFCMGCHSAVGATTDSTFVFARKLDRSHFQNGWYHWTQKGLEGLKEPRNKKGEYEYTYYLKQNHAGDEFRSNDEILNRFFNQDGSLDQQMVNALHDDITRLIAPSRKRASTLNKAYRVIVKEQSFIHGRDATATPSLNVHEAVEDGQETGLKAID